MTLDESTWTLEHLTLDLKPGADLSHPLIDTVLHNLDNILIDHFLRKVLKAHLVCFFYFFYFKLWLQH